MINIDRIIWTMIALTLCISCKDRSVNAIGFASKTDIRSANKYVSIYIDRDGRCQVIKGNGSSYFQELRALSADSSEIFIIDSPGIFFRTLDTMSKRPFTDSTRTDSPRIEIYYEGKKIYDAFKSNEDFWSLFRSVMTKLPEGYNPFRAGDSSIN